MWKNETKTYLASRTPKGVVVTVNGLALSPRFDLRNHSPDGFNWGYNGSAPAQLALALCADALEEDHRALNIYQLFKDRVLVSMKADNWHMERGYIVDIVGELEVERDSTPTTEKDSK